MRKTRAKQLRLLAQQVHKTAPKELQKAIGFKRVYRELKRLFIRGQ